MRADRQRLDKWLWFARFAKTRSLAARLIEDGFVRVNGQRADAPSKALAVATWSRSRPSTSRRRCGWSISASGGVRHPRPGCSFTISPPSPGGAGTHGAD